MEIILPVYFEEYDHTNPLHLKAAEQIAGWSEQSGSMIPLSSKSMSRHLKGQLAFIEQNDQLAGYAGITIGYTEQLVEFGGLVTDPKLRRKGIGQSITEYVLDHFEGAADHEIIAFANDKSSKLFEKLGYAPLTGLGKCALAKDVWKLCQTCPTKPNDFSGQKPNCCDTIYDLTASTGGQSHA